MKKSDIPNRGKLDITYFQRRPRPGFNFSVEYIFNDVRSRLKDKINAIVYLSSYFNDGYLSKFYNMKEARKRRGRCNHITGEVHFLDLLMKKKTVVLTILDCGMVHRKKGIAKLLIKYIYLKLPVHSARFVTTISEETKKEIIKYTRCKAEKISVIPVAVDKIYQAYPKYFNTLKPTVLHIGTGANKNLSRLIQALEGINCELTIIGKLTQTHIDELNNCSIHYTNYYNITQQEMLERYRQCDILSFVSTFEGFGMPIVEANCVERAVITSNISSMPEVAGNAACLVDPYNVSEIKQGILKLINDENYRDELIKNGRKNKLRFDGNTIASSYYDLYKKIYNSS